MKRYSTFVRWSSVNEPYMGWEESERGEWVCARDAAHLLKLIEDLAEHIAAVAPDSAHWRDDLAPRVAAMTPQ